MKKVVILGSTGSIGKNALEVLRNLEGFELVGIYGGRNRELLLKQAEEWGVEYIGLVDEKEAGKLRWRRVLSGIEGACELASLPGVDVVVLALVGSCAVYPLLSALKSGKRVAMANKEAVVAYGPVIEKEKFSGEIIPVDSEHSSLFQCIKGREKEVERIYLTASGGPFRERESLEGITVEEALRHPTWSMGKKITIDSATLMNKGLEVIEATFLFGFPVERIKVVIHPQSIIHGMVELKDGSFLAHLSWPDMKLPIQYALTYPERKNAPVKPFNPVEAGKLTFEEPDMERFPLLSLAYRAGKEKGTLPAVLNAANEEAVKLFLEEKLSFTGIFRVVERVVELHKVIENPSFEDIEEAERWAREEVKRCT